MSRFAGVDDQYDPEAVTDRVAEYWEEIDAYERTKRHREGGDPYFFVDGPPYTSGAAHLGTTWNKALKDATIRYLRMRGYDVTDRPGYDMHGLPIETQVEERLGFENKKDIEDYGEQRFIDACKEYAEDRLEAMQADFRSFGVWMDWENPYRTLSPEYMEAAWWGFKRAAERGLVEKGNRSISQCPRCETAIANNEVEYEQVTDPSIYVRLELLERDASLVIWTTTPWTLPANTFVAVDPDLAYCTVAAERADGTTDRLVVAEACLEEVLSAGEYVDHEVLETQAGADLVGVRYEHPLAETVPDHPDGPGTLEVYPADYVEADRTGLVHSAPGHGEEDFERGRELGLPVVCPVGEDGVFTEAAGAYAGAFVKDADERIIADLDERDLLLASDRVQHSYGHCWRCDTGIIQIVTEQWFITITDVKADLLAKIDESEWFPTWARDNRFRDFVEDAPDWNVSRQRYWGIPLPVWTPEGGDDKDRIVVGTREELADRVDQDVDPSSVDLHKDTVDDLTITEDGTTYTRVPDVFDVWLDSSVASWGTLDYPSSEAAFEDLWPADLIIEAHDQTRGWFWSQLGMGTAALDEIPYERVVMHGHALDADGRKMSKSVGNVVEPGEAIDRHGADAMRLFLLSANPQGEDMRFSWDGMRTMEDHLRTLWNVFRFPLPYMDLDGYDPGTADPDAVADALEPLDRWVLSRLQSTTETMTAALEEFRHDRALEALLAFVDEDVSRYYVQAIRERAWEEADSPSKTAAYTTLSHVLLQSVTLLAPFAPFLTEDIYGTLTGETGHPTVHMADWPTVEERWHDPALERDVSLLRAAEEAGARARQEAGRKRRWPVSRLVVAAEDDRLAAAIDRRGSLLADRLNARTVELVPPGETWGELSYAAEADMSELGPAVGDRAGAVMEAMNAARLEEPTLEDLEAAVADATGEPVSLGPEMVSFVSHPPAGVTGAPITHDGETVGAVYVDTALTEDIESEGYAREVIRRVQEMRKDLDLDVEERVTLEMTVGDDRVAALLAERTDLITEEVRAAECAPVSDGHRREWDVEGVPIELAIEPQR